jgi:hypothetical protein
MIIEQQPDALTTLGDDPMILADFKRSVGFSDDPDWTESDRLLSRCLTNAERIVDSLVSSPYRQRTYKVSYVGFDIKRIGNTPYYVLPVPVRPVASVTITWTDVNGVTGTYTSLDFKVLGGLKPMLVFPATFVPPDFTNVPYALEATLVAGGDGTNETHMITIFELAAHHVRFPEAADNNELPLSNVFVGHLDALKGSFL